MRRIWIDTDVALGADRGDVDDGFAIAAVLAAVRARPDTHEILGISAVSGNTAGAIAHRAAQDLVRVFGAEVPVIGELEAPRAIAALPDSTEILTIGPPGNVVRAARLDPSLAERVTVRVVGTVLDRRRHPILPYFCLNFRHDPAASREFFRLRFRQRRIFPLDVVRKLAFGARELDRIAGTGAHGAYLSHHSRRWLPQAPLRYQSRRFPVWDLVAALDVIDALPGAVWRGDKLERFAVEAAYENFLGLLGAESGR